MNYKQLVDNWYMGNMGGGIPPLEMLSHNDITHCSTAKNPNLGKMKLRQMKSIMTVFEQQARIEGSIYKTRKNGAVNTPRPYGKRSEISILFNSLEIKIKIYQWSGRHYTTTQRK